MTPLNLAANPGRERGFTLIELMIVVAIIGILAAVALPAYQRYIETTNSTKLDLHFNQAVRSARTKLIKMKTQSIIGAVDTATLSAQYDSSAEWLSFLLNAAGDASAPEGGPPFVSGAGDAIIGAVGVAVTQGTVVSADLIVTFTRPAYGAFSGGSAVITNVCWDNDAPACNS